MPPEISLRPPAHAHIDRRDRGHLYARLSTRDADLPAYGTTTSGDRTSFPYEPDPQRMSHAAYEVHRRSAASTSAQVRAFSPLSEENASAAGTPAEYMRVLRAEHASKARNYRENGQSELALLHASTAEIFATAAQRGIPLMLDDFGLHAHTDHLGIRRNSEIAAFDEIHAPGVALEKTIVDVFRRAPNTPPEQAWQVFERGTGLEQYKSHFRAAYDTAVQSWRPAALGRAPITRPNIADARIPTSAYARRPTSSTPRSERHDAAPAGAVGAAHPFSTEWYTRTVRPGNIPEHLTDLAAAHYADAERAAQNKNNAAMSAHRAVALTLQGAFADYTLFAQAARENDYMPSLRRDMWRRGDGEEPSSARVRMLEKAIVGTLLRTPDLVKAIAENTSSDAGRAAWAAFHNADGMEDMNKLVNEREAIIELRGMVAGGAGGAAACATSVGVTTFLLARFVDPCCAAIWLMPGIYAHAGIGFVSGAGITSAVRRLETPIETTAPRMGRLISAVERTNASASASGV